MWWNWGLPCGPFVTKESSPFIRFVFCWTFFDLLDSLALCEKVPSPTLFFLLLFFKHTRDRLSMSHYFSALLFGIIHKVAAFIFKLCDFEWKLFCFSWSEEGDCVWLDCDFGLEIRLCSALYEINIGWYIK